MKYKFFLILCLLPVFLFFSHGICGDSTSPSELRVVIDDTYPPYIMKDSQGNLIGILPELWQLFGEQTGIRVILIGTDWEKAQDIILKGEADVIDTMFRTAEREKVYDFSKPYADIPVSIFHHRSLSGIVNVQSLYGFTVAVKAGDACINVLEKEGVSSFRFYPSYEEIIKNASKEIVKIFCMDDPPAMYYVEKYGVYDLFRKAFTLYTGQFHRAVKKGRVDLLTVVERGFSEIPPEEVLKIREKWMGRELAKTYPYLEYVGIGSLVILTLMVLSFVWNAVLQIAVRKKLKLSKNPSIGSMNIHCFWM